MEKDISSSTVNGLRLVVYHNLPGTNRILAMNPWQRARERLLTQCAVLCALKATAADSLTEMEFGSNTLSTLCDELESYTMTRRRSSTTKSNSTTSPANGSNAPKSL